MKKTIPYLLAWLVSTVSYAQYTFCEGTKGDPIFFEDFGSGMGYGPALPASVTTYTFVTGWPEDGQYSLYSNTGLGNNFHNRMDHTPNDINGKSLIVNADYNPGEFYRREVSGLCINTTFEFTAWVMNVYNPANNACPNMGIPVNVKFQIWNATETELLAEMSTGNINGSYNADWVQFGLTFTTIDDTNVVLKMLNNAPGGCGNDLAIDDIMFRSCGAAVELSDAHFGDSAIICDDEFPIELDLRIDLAEPANYVYQWQYAADGETFTDLPGVTGLTYQANQNSPGSIRVKIAEDIVNLNNPYCYTTTTPFQIIASERPQAPTFIQNQVICEGETIPALEVEVPNGVTVNWYASATANEPVAVSSSTFVPVDAGVYYAEAIEENGLCTSDTRTAVRLTINELPDNSNPTTELYFCNQNALLLDAGIDAVRYEWSNDLGTTRQIAVLEPGTYTVKAYNAFDCATERTFLVKQYLTPVITSVQNEGSTLFIQLANPGDFSYSLDGISWQSEPVFTQLEGGVYTVYVKENHGCGQITATHIVLLPMRFFTPNNDGHNDLFTFTAFDQHDSGYVRIFDRYGRFIIELTPQRPTWDGTFQDELLPSSDYWYQADLGEGKILRGHFTLKR